MAKINNTTEKKTELKEAANSLIYRYENIYEFEKGSIGELNYLQYSIKSIAPIMDDYRETVMNGAIEGREENDCDKSFKDAVLEAIFEIESLDLFEDKVTTAYELFGKALIQMEALFVQQHYKIHRLGWDAPRSLPVSYILEDLSVLLLKVFFHIQGHNREQEMLSSTNQEDAIFQMKWYQPVMRTNVPDDLRSAG